MTAEQQTEHQEAEDRLNKLLENPPPREDEEAWTSFREEVRRLLTELPEAPRDAMAKIFKLLPQNNLGE